MKQPDKLPPEDIGAEQCLLGHALLDARVAAGIRDKLAADDFYREAHRQIFAAMRDVAAAGAEPNLITVHARLKQQGLAEQCGGGEYLMALMNEAASVTEVSGAVAIVRDRATLRALIQFGADVQEQAAAQPDNADAFVAESVTRMLGFAERRQQSRVMSVADGFDADAAKLHAAINAPYGVTPARSGMPDLDKATGGYGGMYLVVMMSEQKAGKTSFAVQTALSSAQQFAKSSEPPRVFVAPLEEGRASWVRLACCWLARVNSKLTLPGRCPDWQREATTTAIAAAHSELCSLPIVIADRMGNVEEIVSAVQVEQHKHPIGLIVVDYLQRLSSGDQERQSLTQIARDLQTLSEQVGAPLLLSSQMSWSEQTGKPLTYGSRGGVFDASLVMSLKRDVDEATKYKLDSGVIRCEWARSIPEFGERAYWTDYDGGGRYFDAEQRNKQGDMQRVQAEEGDPFGDEPDQRW